jgi:hypothetical protein
LALSEGATPGAVPLAGVAGKVRASRHSSAPLWGLTQKFEQVCAEALELSREITNRLDDILRNKLVNEVFLCIIGSLNPISCVSYGILSKTLQDSLVGYDTWKINRIRMI